MLNYLSGWRQLQVKIGEDFILANLLLYPFAYVFDGGQNYDTQCVYGNRDDSDWPEIV